MRLHKIQVEKISLFHLKKCAVNHFWLLPVMFQVNQFDLCTEVYHICILYHSMLTEINILYPFLLAHALYIMNYSTRA